ncbi:MAG TPA: hypothetical protein VGG26_11205 [Terracidiphilus sp.]|jgi:hypothetical protein
MPDLSSQIGILYRVIGQSQPAYDCPAPRRVCRKARGHWICSIYCLWFSLPLSIWLSGGSIGLFLYWQALAGAACLVEKFGGKPRMAFAGFDSSEGDLV